MATMNDSQPKDFLTPQYQVLPPLPNASVSLILGILSIVICGIGLALGIVGIVMANKDIKLFKATPGVYSESSYKNTTAGRICSITGIILSSLFILIYIVIFILAFTANINDFKRL